MMDLTTYTESPRYMVVTDFGNIGAQGYTYDNLDDACDNYAAMMDDGDDSRVYAVTFADGTIDDITAEAALVVAKRCNDNAIAMPDWLYEALPASPMWAAQ